MPGAGRKAENAMEYDVGDMLDSLFGGALATPIATAAQPVVVPKPVEVPTPPTVELPAGGDGRNAAARLR